MMNAQEALKVSKENLSKILEERALKDRKKIEEIIYEEAELGRCAAFVPGNLSPINEKWLKDLGYKVIVRPDSGDFIVEWDDIKL